MGAGRAASVVKAGSQEGVNRGSGAMMDSILYGDAPLGRVEKDCCMATGWADAMIAVHSCACRGPSVTGHDPESLYALPEYMTEQQ